MELSQLNLMVFILYIGLVVLIGFWVARREKKSSRHYFLAGNQLPWYAIGTSLIASSISTEQFIGEVGFAYRYGIAVANWGWSVFPAMTVMIVFFVPFYLRKHISTMPECLERRFGPSSRITFGVITILSYIFINLAGVLFAGGLASVVWTDLFQAILLLGGGLLVFFLGLHEVGGWQAMRGTGDRAHLILSADHPELPWTGILVLTLSTHLWYYATNQYINQRVLGARSEWDARAGVIFAGFLGIFLTLAVCFPGVIAYRLFPNLENPDQAYPRIVSRLIGPLGFGIRGLVFAALIGAIMSTIDSLVNSCSTVLTIDFYQRLWKPSATEREMIRVGRYTAAGVLLLGVAWTPIVGRWETLFGYFQECWFFMAVPIVVVFVSALLWPRSNNFSATATMLLCIPMSLLPAVLKALHVEVNSFVLAGILLVPVVAFHVALSYMRSAPEPTRVRQWTWKRQMLFLPAEEKVVSNPWYKNLLLWWGLVTAAYVAIYIIFW